MLDVFKTKSTYNRIVLAAIPFMAVCSTLISSLLAAGISLLAVVITTVIVSALKRILNEKTATFAQIIIAIGVVGVLSMLFSLFAKESIAELSAYLPLAAVTSVLLISSDFALNNTVIVTLVGSGTVGIANAMFLVLSGALREILGLGSICGADLYTKWFSPIDFFTTPAGGLLIAALLTMLYNLLVNGFMSRKEAKK